VSQQLQPPSQPYLIQAQAAYSCPKCSQPIKSIFRSSGGTSEWLLLVIAIILTPVLIGIFFWIAYFSRKRNERDNQLWHCESCGWQAAILTPEARKRRALNAKLALAGICIAILYALWGASGNPESKSAASPTPTPVAFLNGVKKHDAEILARNSLADIQADYQKLLNDLFPHMNWIKVKYAGSGKSLHLYGYHNYFSHLTLTLGSEGPAISRWVSQNETRLKAAGIKQVGIYGLGYAPSGSYFTVD
jgi:ribosomal protein L37AE/L43A